LGALAQSLRYRGPLFKKLESERSTRPATAFPVFTLDNMVLPADGLRVPYAGWTEFETGPVAMLQCFSRGRRKKDFRTDRPGFGPGPTA